MGRGIHNYAFRCVVIGGGILALLVSALPWYFGSLTLATAYIRGEHFMVSPDEADLGECETGTRHVAKFTVTNLTNHPIRVVGSEEGCPCLTLDELPITLGPHESRDISVRAYVSGKGEYSEAVLLYIDDGELRSVLVHIRALVQRPKDKAEGRMSWYVSNVIADSPCQRFLRIAPVFSTKKDCQSCPSYEMLS